MNFSFCIAHCSYWETHSPCFVHQGDSSSVSKNRHCSSGVSKHAWRGDTPIIHSSPYSVQAEYFMLCSQRKLSLQNCTQVILIHHALFTKIYSLIMNSSQGILTHHALFTRDTHSSCIVPKEYSLMHCSYFVVSAVYALQNRIKFHRRSLPEFPGAIIF